VTSFEETVRQMAASMEQTTDALLAFLKSWQNLPVEIRERVRALDGLQEGRE